MTEHDFDRAYWDEHWQRGAGGAMATSPPNPHLVREVADLTPGTALEAGCGAGAEAIWLATQGWTVLAADISAEALATANERAAAAGVADRIGWLEADLSVWEPRVSYDLVTTHYAHPSIPQLEFYDRLAGWVAPGGILLVVGHLAGEHGHGHGHAPAEASVTAASIAARFDAGWDVVTAAELTRAVGVPEHERQLHDVVVRAVRRG